MPHSATFHLGIHCFQKYPLQGIDLSLDEIKVPTGLLHRGTQDVEAQVSWSPSGYASAFK